jgi:hypothetical protein
MGIFDEIRCKEYKDNNFHDKQIRVMGIKMPGWKEYHPLLIVETWEWDVLTILINVGDFWGEPETVCGIYSTNTWRFGYYGY